MFRYHDRDHVAGQMFAHPSPTWPGRLARRLTVAGLVCLVVVLAGAALAITASV